MTRGETIAERRARVVLDKKIRLSTGEVVTRGEFVDRARRNGGKLVIAKVRQEKAEEKLRLDFERARRRAPIGNPNHPETQEMYALRDRLRDGIFKDDYRLFFPDGTFYSVTKIEADYFSR